MFEDCAMCKQDDCGYYYCDALIERMCITRGKCKFYKNAKQVSEERARCEERISRLIAQGVKIPALPY